MVKNFGILKELLVIISASLPLQLVSNKLRIPPLVGFLLTGLLVGPGGLGIVSSPDEIELLAEIGVILLLFTIGLEFSLRKLLEIRRFVILGGGIQIGLTMAAVAGMMIIADRPFGESLLWGWLISLSSTALVISMLHERGELDSVHGRLSFAILILQDIAIVPLTLFVPLLSSGGDASISSIAITMGKGLVVLAVTLIAAWRLVPWLLHEIAKTQSRELFLLSVMAVCFAVAFIAEKAGLSLALGALLAGLVISESEFSHQALSAMLPFKYLFTTVFFVSVGMLLDVTFALDHLGSIAIAALLVMVGKTAIVLPAARALGLSLRVGLIAGLTVSQIGEFSFVLAQSGLAHGVLAPQHYQYFLAITIVTMLATPFVVDRAALIGRWGAHLGLLGEGEPEAPGRVVLTDHVLIVGFGVNGSTAARACRAAAIPFAVIDLNPANVRRARAEGYPIVFGDASEEAVLCAEGIADARMVIITIPDAIEARRITSMARHLNSRARIVVRTRLLKEITELYSCGADEVVSEEFETAVEIFSRILAAHFVPQAEIERLIQEVRSNGYQMMRSSERSLPLLRDLELQSTEYDLVSLAVGADSAVAGKTVVELGLRNMFDATVLAIRRDGQILPNPGGDLVFCPGDLCIFFARRDRFPELQSFFGMKGEIA